MGFLPENQVRARLPAGGNRIRTIGSAGGARHPRGRRVTFPLTFPRGGINQKRHEPALKILAASRGTKWFESGFLRRGASSEPRERSPLKFAAEHGINGVMIAEPND